MCLEVVEGDFLPATGEEQAAGTCLGVTLGEEELAVLEGNFFLATGEEVLAAIEEEFFLESGEPCEEAVVLQPEPHPEPTRPNSGVPLPDSGLCFPDRGVPRPEEGVPLPDPKLPRIKMGVPSGLAAGEAEAVPDSGECGSDPDCLASSGLDRGLRVSCGAKDLDLLLSLVAELLGELLPEVLEDSFLTTGCLVLD